MKRSALLSSAAIIVFFSVFLAHSGFYLGPGQAIREKARLLKEYKDEEEADVWQEPKSPLNGVYQSGKYRFTQANQPFIVEDDVDIKESRVVIEAGVRFQVNPGKTVTFSGPASLTVTGRAGDPVIFTSSNSPGTPGEWGRLVINKYSVDIDYMTVENAEDPVSFSSSGAVRNTIVKASLTSGISIIGDGTSATILLENCNFTNNNDAGVIVDSSSNAVEIKKCKIIENNYDNIGKADEELIINNISGTSGFTLEECSISGTKTLYNLTTHTSHNIKAEYNWWGSTSPAIGYLAGSGSVDFLPYRVSESTAAGVGN